VGTSDSRASEARRLHTAAGRSDAAARRDRERRDHLVRALRADDPGRWTYPALARAVGCSPELIAHIVRTGPVRQP